MTKHYAYWVSRLSTMKGESMGSPQSPEEPNKPRSEEFDFTNATGPTDIGNVPWFRRSDYCSAVILAHVFVMLCGGCIPIVSLLGLVTTVGVIAVCIVVLTGPVYYNNRRKNSSLRVWSGANKVAAVILLILFVGGYIALLTIFVMNSKFG